jgi:seryl-tRNA synthetase
MRRERVMKMLDMKWIRENQEQVQQAAASRGIVIELDSLITLDDQLRKQRYAVDQERTEQNKLAKEIAKLVGSSSPEQAELFKQKARDKQQKLLQLESGLKEIQGEWEKRILTIPNILSPDTPYGRTDFDNVVLETMGVPPEFDFEPKDHVALAESLDLLDIARGVKVAGSRNYFLKGLGQYLHRAVQQLAIDVLADRGFTVMDVPVMAREEALTNSAFFPSGKEQTYELADEGKWLVGTSEVPLISYYASEVVDVLSEPIRLAAVSNCFRKEAGSAGRDVRGLYRVHQFAKVEQVIICRNDLEHADAMLQEITSNAEHLLQLLELPYRKVAVCSGDLGYKNYKQYDLETWMPSRGGYGETQSASSLLDFQARRSRIRYKDEQGQLSYCYTLNCTAIAAPRILIPLLEIHQQMDGSIYIPEALRPYMRGLERIG